MVHDKLSCCCVDCCSARENQTKNKRRSWADEAIDGLKSGNTVQIRPKGNSMRGRIESGQLVTIVPCAPEDISSGDIVLAKVKGRIYLHLVSGIALAKKRRIFLIKNNRGRTNGWTSIVYGKVTKVE